MMDFDEFVKKLYEAGWESPNDAQWAGIKQLWGELLQEGIKMHLSPTAEHKYSEEECLGV